MVVLALLMSVELPALGIQEAELPLVEHIHCSLHWKDGVEVVAIPLHPAPVKILAVLHHDEVLFQVATRMCWTEQRPTGFYHRAVEGGEVGGGAGAADRGAAGGSESVVRPADSGGLLSSGVVRALPDVILGHLFRPY